MQQFKEMEQLACVEEGKFLREMEAKYQDSFALDYMSKDEMMTWHKLGQVGHEAYCAYRGITDEAYEQKSIVKWNAFFEENKCICNNCVHRPFKEDDLKYREMLKKGNNSL